MRLIDLHTHTTASDGTLTPTQLIQLAAECQLAAVAVTDHDTVAGYREAATAGRQRGIEVIPGIEISAAWPKGTLHILGYLIDPDNTQLGESMARLRTARDARNPAILARLAELGMPLEMAEVEARAGGTVIGRPHIAGAMLARGYVSTMREAFDRYLGEKGLAYVDKECLSPAEACRAIHAAGGLAVVAHPRWLNWTDHSELEFHILELVHAGIDGIECFHSDHTDDDEAMYQKLAFRYDLVTTGGSDFHGVVKGDIRLGRGRGGLRITTDILDGLKAAKARISGGKPTRA